MSLIFFDGFDQYNNFQDAVIKGGWSNWNSGAGGAGGYITNTVRVGTGAAIILDHASPYGGGADAAFLSYQTPTNEYGNTIYCGFALNLPYGASTYDFFRINAVGLGAAAQLRMHVFFITTTTYQLQLYRGATLLATGSSVLHVNSWRYVEFKVLIDPTSGVCECKIDSVVDFSFSGNTCDTGAHEVGGIVFVGNGGFFTGAQIDDFYLCNSLGTFNNTYLGEQRAEIMTPNADNTVAWVRNTGASNFSAVADPIGLPDENTTYVSSSTLNAKDEYDLTNITGITNVAGVKLVTRAERDNISPRTFKHGIKSGSIEQQVVHNLGIDYVNYIDIFETSDGGTTAFTPTTTNSLISTIEVSN